MSKSAYSINEIFIIFLCAAAIHPIPDIPDFFTDFLGLLLGQFVQSANSGSCPIDFEFTQPAITGNSTIGMCY